MPMRHAQRKHIIQSLTSLLYQLHTVSFLLSPRLWPFICRISTQSPFTRPRESDPQRSLRFWFTLVLVVNIQCFYHHIFKGAAEGRSIVLDFVGVAYKPSKTLLLSLDVVIVVLEFILITIAYETSFTLAMPPDTPDPLQPESTHAVPPSLPLGEEGPSTKTQEESTFYDPENEYIIDLQLRTLLQRLAHPPIPPPPPQRTLTEELLPLPNTTPFQLSRSLNMLVRARAELRERAARAAETTQTNRSRNDRDRRRERQPGESTETRRVPGGMGEEL